VPELSCGFVLRVPPEQAQHDGIAEVRGQSSQFLIKNSELVNQIAGLVRAFTRPRFGGGGFVVSSAARCPLNLPRHPTGNTHQPASHGWGRARRPEPRRENQKNGLERVLGRTRAREPVTDAVHHRTVPMNEFGERVLVPLVREPGEQFAIGGGCGEP
jgi:hypothetical protein